jgi:hypothetical protein
MFRKTIAVGPLELVESWVTGGTATVAMYLDLRSPWLVEAHTAVVDRKCELAMLGALRESWVSGDLTDMATRLLIRVICYLGAFNSKIQVIMRW